MDSDLTSSLTAKHSLWETTPTTPVNIAGSEMVAALRSEHEFCPYSYNNLRVGILDQSEVDLNLRSSSSQLLSFEMIKWTAVGRHDVSCTPVCNQGRAAAYRGSTGGTIDVPLMQHKIRPSAMPPRGLRMDVHSSRRNKALCPSADVSGGKAE